MHAQRVVKQWANWKLVCVTEEGYALIRHDGLNVDFDAPDEGEAISEAMRLMLEIESPVVIVQ